MLCCLVPVVNGFWDLEGERSRYDGLVWSVETSERPDDNEYRSVIGKILSAFEEETGRFLQKGERGRVGLKVYTNSGVGLMTPPSLVRGLVAELEARGYERSDLFIFDVSEIRLRESRYMPPVARSGLRNEFEGVPVYSFKNPRMIDPDWHYESPLPEFSGMSFLAAEIVARYRTEMSLDTRKSFLPEPLLNEVDFWINLPVLLDSPATGLSGALVNASLWNVTNRDRFFASRHSAPAAAVEIVAIPELQRGWVLSIMSLHQYQYMGGPSFNANYVRGEDRVIASIDPVALDALGLNLINEGRRARSFEELSRGLPLLEFAETLRLGRTTGLKVRDL